MVANSIEHTTCSSCSYQKKKSVSCLRRVSTVVTRMHQQELPLCLCHNTAALWCGDYWFDYKAAQGQMVAAAPLAEGNVLTDVTILAYSICIVH